MIGNLSECDGLRHFDAAAACCEELRALGYSPPAWRALSPSLTVSLESLASLPKGGNMTRLRALRSSFVSCRCCLGALPESVFCFVHKVALWRLPHTLLCPTCPLRRFDLDTFRVLLLRRLRLPLPLSSHSCRTLGLGHHRASCSRAGVLGRRGFALES